MEKLGNTLRPTDEELMTITPMDYETYINIQQYSSDGDYFYNLKVTNVMNEDYYYTGTASTLDDVMLCIEHHLKEHITILNDKDTP